MREENLVWGELFGSPKESRNIEEGTALSLKV